MNSKKDWMVFTYRNTYKSLDELNQPEMKLAGLRVNPVTNIGSTVTYITNLKVRRLKDKAETQIKGLPANPKIAYISFAPNEQKLAFTNTTSKGVELWVADLATATAKKISSDNLNANVGTPYVWMKDSQSLLAKKIPANRIDLIDPTKEVPAGPTVSTADGKVSQNRTYQDLLKNPQDEQNFDTLATAELVKITLDGNERSYKGVAIYTGMSLSPDGNLVMLTTIKRPYSYIVPLSRFPMTSTVYDLNGNLVKNVNEVPLTEIMPKGFSSVRTGKRSMSWRDDEPATLVYAEALDGGDEDVHAAVGEVYLLDDAGHRSHLVQVVSSGTLRLLPQHDDANESVPGIGFLGDTGIVAGGNHQRGEDAGENGTAGNGNQMQFIR